MVGKDGERDKKPKLSLKTFDLVSNPSRDHHYLNTKPVCVPRGPITSKFTKTIRKEWKILNSCLPETIFIFVRSYESRIHLKRASIIGAEGTPYSNALFFFDIHLPPTYPDHPPQLSFHSHGLHLNPNLYSNGYVCLSILNTWHGLESEKWTPGNSIILQVLLSIQALVLNSDPYYNESLIFHLYSIFGEQRMSSAYASAVFVSVCKLMCYELNKPPQEFKHLVETHFRVRANAILNDFRAYCANHMSILLRLQKREMFSELVQAFEKNGACCRDIVDEVNKEEEERNGNCGWFWMFKSIWMKIFSCFTIS